MLSLKEIVHFRYSQFCCSRSLIHCNGGLIHCSVDIFIIICNGPILWQPSSGQSDSSGIRRSGHSVSSANPLPFSAPIHTAHESEEPGHALQLTKEEVEMFEAIKSQTLVDFLHLARFGRFDGIQIFPSYDFEWLHVSVMF